MPDSIDLQIVTLHLLINQVPKEDVLPLDIKTPLEIKTPLGIKNPLEIRTPLDIRKDRPWEISALTNSNIIILLMVPQLLFHRPLPPRLPLPPYPR